MNNLRQKINGYFRDDLFIRNQNAANKRNNTIVRTILISAIICYIFLFAMSYRSGGYSQMRWLYATFMAIFAALLAASFVLKEKAAAALFYIFMFSFIGLCTYSSSFIFPDSVSVMVLLALFGFPALLLDKGWRVNAVSILAAAVYLSITSFYKTPAGFSEELLNVVCFTLFGCVVGGITRKAQLQNYDTMDKLRISREQYKIAVEHSNGIICEFDVARRCVIVESDTAAADGTDINMYGVPYEPVKQGLIDKDSSEAYIQFYEAIIRGDNTGTAEFLRRTADGWRWQNATFTTIFSDSGKPISAVISFIDVTDQRTREEMQKHKAEIDGMTGICNRATTEALIKQALAEKAQGALMIIDIDDFKTVNDLLGHPQGDATLRAVADILKNRFRQTDIVGRVGGDEFAVFMRSVIEQTTVSAILEKLRAQIRAYHCGEHGEHQISVSIGIVLCNANAPAFDELYKMADIALYSAKKSGKDQYAFFPITKDLAEKQ